MSDTPLTIRSFGDVLKPKMSKTARKKYYDPNKCVFEMPHNAIERDASKQETLYELLFESLTYTLFLDESFRFPDISKSWISETINNRIPINSEVIKAAQKQEAATVVAAYFSHNIIPNIPKHLLSVVVDSVEALIQGDSSLGKNKRVSLKSAKERKSEADYLADVWVLAVCRSAELQIRKPSKGACENVFAESGGAQESCSQEKPGDAVEVVQSRGFNLFSRGRLHIGQEGCLYGIGRKTDRSEKQASSLARTVQGGENKAKPKGLLAGALFALFLATAMFFYWGVLFTPALVVAESQGPTADLEVGASDSNYYIDLGEYIKPAREKPMYSRPYVEIGDSDGYVVRGNDANNRIKVFSRDGTALGNGRNEYSNFVTYPLNGEASVFTAILNPPKYPGFDPELTYRILGDGILLFMRTMESDTSSLEVEIDTAAVEQLTIELVLVSKTYHSFSDPFFLGIQNATIKTTDY